MGNLIQKIIYNLSIFSPSLFTFAISYYKSSGNITVPLIISFISSIFVLGVVIQLIYFSKNMNIVKLTPKNIKIEKPITHLQLISYLAPLLSNYININITYFIVAPIAIIIYSILINTTSPNPILFLLNYKFYIVDLENRIGGYLLISKINLNNYSQVKRAYHLFDYTLIHIEDKYV